MMELDSYKIMFLLFSAIIIVFSLITIFSRRILRAAVALLFVLISTAGLYFMLDYQFMAGVQLTLYAGGIVVLIIFSILLTSTINQRFPLPDLLTVMAGGLVAVIGAGVSIYSILTYTFIPTTAEPIKVDMEKIGHSLLDTGHNGFVLPFEVISILLLAAMIGAIIIAKKGK